MPKKINIDKLLKRSARERALVLCDDYVFQAWGNTQNFTDEERVTVVESFVTDRQQQMWNKIVRQEMKLRNFIPYLEDRMMQALEATRFFNVTSERYSENMGNEILLNHILELTKKNKALHDEIISLFHSVPVKICNNLKFLPPATVKFTPYKVTEKSFAALVKKAGIDITERVKMAKTHIAAMQQFMNDNRCNIKTYEKIISERVESLKNYLSFPSTSIHLFAGFRKIKGIKWTDTEIFTTEWMPPPYDEIPINQKAFKDACRWLGEY